MTDTENDYTITPDTRVMQVPRKDLLEQAVDLLEKVNKIINDGGTIEDVKAVLERKQND